MNDGQRLGQRFVSLALAAGALVSGCAAVPPAKPITNLNSLHVPLAATPKGPGPLCTLRSVGQSADGGQLVIELSLFQEAPGLLTRQSFYFARAGQQVPLSLAAWRTERVNSSSLFTSAKVTKSGSFVFEGPPPSFKKVIEAWQREGGLFLSLEPAAGGEPVLLSMLAPPTAAVEPVAGCLAKVVP